MTTLPRLLDLIARHHPQLPPLDRDATLASAGIDSLGVIELLFAVEETFGVKVDVDEAAQQRTVGDLAGYIDLLQAAHGTGAGATNGTAPAVAPAAQHPPGHA